jgi:hypothetical protein
LGRIGTDSTTTEVTYLPVVLALNDRYDDYGAIGRINEVFGEKLVHYGFVHEKSHMA